MKNNKAEIKCTCSCHKGYLSTEQPFGDHLKECYTIYHQEVKPSQPVERVSKKERPTDRVNVNKKEFNVKSIVNKDEKINCCGQGAWNDKTHESENKVRKVYIDCHKHGKTEITNDLVCSKCKPEQLEPEWEKDFNKYYGLMFEAGDYEQLVNDISSLLLKQKQKDYEEIERMIEGKKIIYTGRTAPIWRTNNECLSCGKDISDRDRRASRCLRCAILKNKQEQKDKVGSNYYNEAIDDILAELRDRIGGGGK